METDQELPDVSANLEITANGAITLTNSDSSTASFSIEKKAFHLRNLLSFDIRAADLKWSLFVTAFHGFRHETCLKPFPPNYLKDGVKDFDALSDVIATSKRLTVMLEQLSDHSFIAANSQLVDLLFYDLIHLREPYLKTVPNDEFDNILKKVPSDAKASRPQFIFEVVSTLCSQSEHKWQNLKKNRNTFFAYHGSRLENFHSIVHHGLQQHLNKNMVFGSGIYFSSELSVSLPYSPGSIGWANSILGPHLSCVALCEIIDTPEGIKCQKSSLTGNNNGANTSRVRAEDSMAGEVPHKYYLVSNNDLVRVRYLLVYAMEPPSFNRNLNQSIGRAGPMVKWFSKHKLLSILLGYGFMLAVIGFANNQPMQYYYRIILKRIGAAIGRIRT